MKKMFLLGMMCLMALTMQAQGKKFLSDLSKTIVQTAKLYVEAQYVDMGLPSGTKWKKENV